MVQEALENYGVCIQPGPQLLTLNFEFQAPSIPKEGLYRTNNPSSLQENLRCEDQGRSNAKYQESKDCWKYEPTEVNGKNA